MLKMRLFLLLFITSISFNAQALGSKNFLNSYCENLFLTPMILPEKIMKNYEKNNISNIQEITEVYTVLKGVENIEGVDKWLYYHSPRSEVQVSLLIMRQCIFGFRTGKYLIQSLLL